MINFCSAHPAIYTIAPHVPFADVLARWIIAQYGHTQSYLAHVVVLVPSRRACGALQEALLRASDGVPLILPRIFPLGVDEEDVDVLLATTLPPEAIAEWQAWLTTLLPAVHSTQRVMQLAAMIAAHQKDISKEHAVMLADSLCEVLDDCARDGVPLEKLRDAVHADYAEHWQVSLDFLEVIMRDWPAWLADNGLMDVVERRNAMLAMLALCWKKYPPAHPVIAAGTTGSVKATSDLLQVIAEMAQGSIVLPALDTVMAESIWEQLDVTHPQFGLKELLHKLAYARQDVLLLDDVAHAGGHHVQRRRLVDEMMWPPVATSAWLAQGDDYAWMVEAVQGMRVVTCEQEEQEALVVAMHLREVLEIPARTAMVVTHDRALARQIIAVMGMFDVQLDDSAGVPLWSTSSAVFLRLLLQFCESEQSSVALLAVLRHPLCALGMPSHVVRYASRVLEKKYLRGVRQAASLDDLLALCARDAVDAYDSKDLLQVVEVLQVFQKACAPLLAWWEVDVHAPQPMLSFQESLQMLMQVAQACASTDVENGVERLWGGYAGNQLAQRMQTLLDYAPMLGVVAPRYVSGILASLMGKDVFRAPYASHPRLRILSPLEARMQSADVVLLCGLNEDVWPALPTPSAWLSPAMRVTMGLNEQARNIGLSAHDFYALICAHEVVLTRTKKRAGSPTIASRWLLRMEARLQAYAPACALLLQEEMRLLTLVERWMMPVPVAPFAPPEPCPPVSARPQSLSVTRFEMLLRDPYSIYASKILRLKKLDALDEEISMRDFGNAVHKAFELYYLKWSNGAPDNALQEMLSCGQESFALLFNNVRVQRFWWPRFERIAAMMMEEEARILADGRVAVEVEKAMSMMFGSAFEITGIVDRIDRYRDGKISIIDYKTGQLPSKKNILRGVACQLILEQLMFTENKAGEDGVYAEYWKTSDGKKPFEKGYVAEVFTRYSKAEIVEAVWEVIAHFNQGDSPYLSCPEPEDEPQHNDYKDLARRDEWS